MYSSCVWSLLSLSSFLRRRCTCWVSMGGWPGEVPNVCLELPAQVRLALARNTCTVGFVMSTKGLLASSSTSGVMIMVAQRGFSWEYALSDR